MRRTSPTWKRSGTRWATNCRATSADGGAMGNVYEGRLTAEGLRCAIVVSRFNELITRQLLRGAQDALTRHGAAPDAVDVVWVPGAFEVPVVARALAANGRYDAVICLGALI